MKKTEPNRPPIVQVYKDKNGLKWYAYENPLAQPFLRMAAIESARGYEELKITKEKLLETYANMRARMNEGDIVTAMGMLYDLEARMGLAVEEETMLTIASAFFFTKEEFEEEQTSRFNPAQQTKKINYWRENIDCYDFFLESAANELMGFTNLSAKDLISYFEKAQAIIRKNKEEALTTPSKKSTTGSTTWSLSSRKGTSKASTERKL